MQYLVLAWDGDDEDAINRRLAMRDNHLVSVLKMAAEGSLRDGGALLNAEGKMIGSACFVEFDSDEELDDWLDHDPYMTGHVWQEVSVFPINLLPREKLRYEPSGG